MNSYADYATLASGGDADQEQAVALSQLQKLAEQQADEAAKVAELELALEKARTAFRHTSEVVLPEAMERAGLEEFKSHTGLVIKIKEDVRCSIPAPKAAEALAWLRDHGHAALIKRQVSLSFGKGEGERAKLLTEKLVELGYAEYDEKEGVHAQTLSAFVRNALKEGEEIPLELFSVFRQRRSVIDN